MRCSAAFGFYGLGQTGLRVLGSEHLGIGLGFRVETLEVLQNQDSLNNYS